MEPKKIFIIRTEDELSYIFSINADIGSCISYRMCLEELKNGSIIYIREVSDKEKEDHIWRKNKYVWNDFYEYTFEAEKIPFFNNTYMSHYEIIYIGDIFSADTEFAADNSCSWNINTLV